RWAHRWRSRRSFVDVLRGPSIWSGSRSSLLIRASWRQSKAPPSRPLGYRPNALFPLTPALSPGERENRRQGWRYSGVLSITRLHLPPLIGLTDVANATVGRIAQALEEVARHGDANTVDEKKRLPAGVDTWVGPFVVNWNPAPLRSAAPSASPGSAAGQWQII